MIKATDYIGSLILENDTLQFIQTAEGRVVKNVDGMEKNEYQYHLKDHLGNVRTTFAVRDDDYPTDFEFEITNDSTEHPYFPNYDEVSILNNPLKRSGNKAHRLTGGGTDVIGLMKRLYVSKGDKVSAEVYGKYLDAQFRDEGINGAALINALVGMLSGGTVTGEGSMVQNSLNTDFVSAAMADDGQESSPKAYLNYILLDKNFNYLNTGFERLGSSAADPGDGSGTHQKLSFEEILVEEDGYLMVFLSNESEQSVEVFWDDFRVDHHYNAVLQADDYYPFGLTFNSYKREFSKKNKMNTFQDQEYDEETGWVQFKWRNHMPELGRFFNVDPLAEDYYYNSPYAFSENHVTAHIELEGLEKVFFQKALNENQNFKKVYDIQRQTSGGKTFRESLKSQTKLNVLYFQHDGFGTGINKKITSKEQLTRLQKGAYKSIFENVSLNAFDIANGNEGLIVIGIDIDELENTEEGASTLNHEEDHAESTLKGNEGENKNEKDHEAYYGEYRWESPTNEAVLTEDQYRNTKARKQLLEIKKLVDAQLKSENEEKKP